MLDFSVFSLFTDAAQLERAKQQLATEERARAQAEFERQQQEYEKERQKSGIVDLENLKLNGQNMANFPNWSKINFK